MKLDEDIIYGQGLSHQTVNSSNATTVPLRLDVYYPDNSSVNKPVYLFIHWHDYSAFERMVRTKNFIYIENGLWQNSNIGAVEVLRGGAGQAMLKGNKAGSLNKLQGRIVEIPQPKIELYDCENDPNQFNNLADNPKFKSIKEQLSKTLKEWEKEIKDSQPENLTPDWYDRETTKPLKARWTRGDLPGNKQEANFLKGNNLKY